MRERIRIALSAGVAGCLLLSAASLPAHHSFAEFDGQRVVRLKGVVTRFEFVSPHSYIHVESRDENGRLEHWALEGPAPNRLKRMGFSVAAFKPGDKVEACGYPTRAGVNGLRPNASTGVPASKIQTELLVLPDGRRVVWENYRQGKCLETS